MVAAVADAVVCSLRGTVASARVLPHRGDVGKELDVDVGGLLSAAADSVTVAADVLAGGFEGAVSARPSGAGIAAVEAASAAARMRISDRIAGQAGDVAAAGDRYDATDGGSADAISVTM
ncbi:hypothetical protein [Mycolicibacterium vaccae]|uniref:hypothetical protein n=1 Tax=Mycolicibacterium vaccae TaxID=1810 RepID=UPI001181B155|nr:hypothetical protein [Mycolicibacterium vaccae]